MTAPVWEAVLQSTFIDLGIGVSLIVPAYWQQCRRPVLAVAMVSVIPLLFLRPTTGLMMLAVVLAMCIGVWRRVPGWVTVAGGLLSIAAVLPFSAAGHGHSLAHLEVLRYSFPRQSLKDRLSYEQQGDASAITTPTRPLEPTGEPENSLTANSSRRARVLKALHDGTYDHFVASPGRGYERMLYDWEGELFAPAPDRRPFAEPLRDRLAYPADHAGTPADMPLVRNRSDQAPPAAADAPSGPGDLAFDPATGHRRAKADFLDPEAWGFVAGRQTALGFEPHAFHHQGEFSKPDDQVEVSEWRLASLQLVSLLKHDRPMAYISSKLPDMQMLKKAPVRPLDPFETSSLTKLQAGEEIVVDTDPDRIRMLGAIRAGRACLDCHSVEEGTLLGAFSYRLDRGTPLAPPSVTDLQ